MRRTEAHQGVRMIKFRSVLDRYESSELNQIEAAELLGVTERTFRRWCHRYEEGGDAGLLDHRLGGADMLPLSRDWMLYSSGSSVESVEHPCSKPSRWAEAIPALDPRSLLMTSTCAQPRARTHSATAYWRS